MLDLIDDLESSTVTLTPQNTQQDMVKKLLKYADSLQADDVDGFGVLADLLTEDFALKKDQKNTFARPDGKALVKPFLTKHLEEKSLEELKDIDAQVTAEV